MIDRTYSLNETPEAISRVAEGHARGTIVIAVPGLPRAAATSANTATEAPAARPALA